MNQSREVFKKTDTAQLEFTISCIIGIFIVIMPIGYLIQFFGFFDIESVAIGELVLELTAALLLLLDFMYWKQKENRYITVFGCLVLAYALSVVISTFFAKNVSLAISGNSFTKEGGISILSYLVLIYNTALISKTEHRKIIYIAFMILGLLELMLGIMQAVFQAEFLVDEITEEHINGKRALGTMLNPNPYGTVMVMLAGFEYGLCYVAENKRKKIIHAVLSVGFTYAVLLSGTRGAWLALAAAALVGSVFILLYEKKRGKLIIAIKKLGIVFLLVIAAMILFFALSGDTAKGVVDRSQEDISSSSFGEERPVIWKNSFDAYVKQYPVFGVGISNISTLVSAHGAGFAMDIFFVSDAHNRYLNIWCMQGTVGLITYLALLIYILSKLCGNIYLEKSVVNEMLAVFVALVGWMVADIFSIGNIYMMPYFYVMLGLAVGRSESKRLVGVKKQSLE